MSQYKYPCEYSYEAFVQQTVEEYFFQSGFDLIEGKERGYTDIVARNSLGKEWFVEVKGKTSAPGLDLKTAVGQIARRIDREGANYAIAVPRTAAYIKQAQQLSAYYRRQTNLFIMLVDETGHIEISTPEDEIEPN